jgi:hypothetical protein
MGSMRTLLAAFCLTLGIVRSAAADDLADLRAARSVVAESALVFRLERKHQVLVPYAAEMRSLARRQLLSLLEDIPASSREGKSLRAALTALQARDDGALMQIDKDLDAAVREREQAD